MKSYLIMVLAAIAIVFVSGLIAGPLIPPEIFCTEMACFCPEKGTEALECNSCYETSTVFSIGFFRASRVCPGKEILFCDEGDITAGTIQWSKSLCAIRLFWF
ncbi:MAG TPA: hypothetical protein ENN46_01685 [Candidatus Woesearchaeota archaeon]|nr:hypothetical protein [Candidatus Woesearchaeota archaeon]